MENFLMPETLKISQPSTEAQTFDKLDFDLTFFSTIFHKNFQEIKDKFFCEVLEKLSTQKVFEKANTIKVGDTPVSYTKIFIKVF